MTGPRRLLATLAVTCALVPATASASTSDDEHVTWDQVRTALVAAHRLPPALPPTHRPTSGPHPVPPQHPAPPRHPAPSPAPTVPPAVPPAGGALVSVTVPDLSWALDDAAAAPGIRRAACHQLTGLDDETSTPLAACLAHVRRLPTR